MINRRCPGVVLLSLWVAGSAGCGYAQGREAARNLQGELPSTPPALPDLSTSERSVEEQLITSYTALMVELKNPAASRSSQGAAYGATGRLLMAAEMYEAAEPFLMNAMSLEPQEARWPYYLAHISRIKNDLENALRLLERTAELVPDYEAVAVWRGFVYLDVDRLADAEAQFSKGYRLNSQSAAVLFGRGRVALMRRDYTRAAEHFEAALRLDPDAGVVRYPLATAYRAMGENAKADAQLRLWKDQDVSLRDPFMDEVGEILESSLAYELRGDRELRREQWSTAVLYYRRSAELAPGNAERHHKLGTAMLAAGDMAGAASQFLRALQLAPTLAKPHLSLGVISRIRGQQEEALKHFREAIKGDPSDLEAQLLLADALRIQGSVNEALSHYETALEMDPRVPRAKYGYAMALLGAHRYGEAWSQLSEGMQLYPEHRQFADALAKLR